MPAKKLIKKTNDRENREIKLKTKKNKRYSTRDKIQRDKSSRKSTKQQLVTHLRQIKRRVLGGEDMATVKIKN